MTDDHRKDPEAVSRLTPEQYRVTQKNGTEPPFRNDYWDNKEPGIYVDVVSGEPLFSSAAKFDSRTGWPSFTAPLEPRNVVKRRDFRMLIPGPRSAPPTAAATWGTCSTTGPGKPAACATASTPPPCASSRPATWNARATAPTASFSNRQTRPAAPHDDEEGSIAGIAAPDPEQIRCPAVVRGASGPGADRDGAGWWKMAHISAAGVASGGRQAAFQPPDRSRQAPRLQHSSRRTRRPQS